MRRPPRRQVRGVHVPPRQAQGGLRWPGRRRLPGLCGQHLCHVRGHPGRRMCTMRDVLGRQIPGWLHRHCGARDMRGVPARAVSGGRHVPELLPCTGLQGPGCRLPQRESGTGKRRHREVGGVVGKQTCVGRPAVEVCHPECGVVVTRDQPRRRHGVCVSSSRRGSNPKSNQICFT